jgi:phosphatidylglycerol:prolipoprotein diacylglycerol transferase
VIPVLLFPNIDPVLIQLGPFAIRWYALAYIAGIVLSWRLMRYLAHQPPAIATNVQVDDFVSWATLGIVLGGRLGYCLFYQPSLYLADPLSILRVWTGGMSFHGGMLGVAIAIVWFCRHYRISILGFADRLSVCAPIGLGLGRAANFVNGELWGRPAPDWLPWAMKFPRTPDCPSFPDICIPRHPSQIYQALMEGVLLFAIMFLLSRRRSIRARFGTLTGVFLAGYAVARTIGEVFREPDAFLGFLKFGLTMGQLLSAPMLLAGLCLIFWPRAWRSDLRRGLEPPPRPDTPL